MFDKIRYKLDGVEIDRNRNVGITSTLKNYITVSSDRSVILRNWWDAHTGANGYFNFCVPLYILLGFCEDYRRVVINARHEKNNNDLDLILKKSVKVKSTFPTYVPLQVMQLSFKKFFNKMIVS